MCCQIARQYRYTLSAHVHTHARAHTHTHTHTHTEVAGLIINRCILPWPIDKLTFTLRCECLNKIPQQSKHS
jgi:hypothetical protein